MNYDYRRDSPPTIDRNNNDRLAGVNLPSRGLLSISFFVFIFRSPHNKRKYFSTEFGTSFGYFGEIAKTMTGQKHK